MWKEDADVQLADTQKRELCKKKKSCPKWHWEERGVPAGCCSAGLTRNAEGRGQMIITDVFFLLFIRVGLSDDIRKDLRK